MSSTMTGIKQRKLSRNLKLRENPTVGVLSMRQIMWIEGQDQQKEELSIEGKVEVDPEAEGPPAPNSIKDIPQNPDIMTEME